MTNTTKRMVKPTFSDIVQLIRQQYREGFHIEIGYAKAAELLDEAIKPQLNVEVTSVLSELEKQSHQVRLIDSKGEISHIHIDAVPVEAIQSIKEKL